MIVGMSLINIFSGSMDVEIKMLEKRFILFFCPLKVLGIGGGGSFKILRTFVIKVPY